MLVEKISKTLKDSCNIKPNDLFVLGFSGGADSVCLLDALAKLKYRFHIAYFNHQLRGAVEQEVQFVKKVAEKYAIDFTIGTKDILSLAKNDGKGIEETARFYRYQYLIKTAKINNAVGVAVAHHADDQVETILMNMLRGTGLKGLIGMDFVSFSEFSVSIPIIRPMLNIWKNEILDYCQENNLAFSVDETNTDENYTRNKIRGSLIPTLEEYNPQIKRALTRTGTILGDEFKFITEYSEKALKKMVLCNHQGYVKLDLLKFKKHPVSVQRNIIDCLLDNYFYLENNKTFYLIETIRKVLSGEISGHYSKLLVDLHVMVEENVGYIFTDILDLNNIDDLVLANEGKTLEKSGVTTINEIWNITCEILPIEDVKTKYASNENMYIAYLDAETVGDNLSLGKWQEGIRYAPLGLSGHSMKLSDFWINKGFPKRKRDTWPLVIADKEIIWIPGFQPAYSVRITRSTRDVLKILVDKT